MNAILTGLFSAIFVILIISLLKKLDKKLMYSLILAGIGFLYVGFVWAELQAVIVNALQAILFLFLAYLGMKEEGKLLAIDYFLHGIWDLGYHYVLDSALIPPDYDLFCSTLDFTIGIYLLLWKPSFKTGQIL